MPFFLLLGVYLMLGFTIASLLVKFHSQGPDCDGQLFLITVLVWPLILVNLAIDGLISFFDSYLKLLKRK